MSKTQLKILWIGIVIFVLMGLFPRKEYLTPEGSYADGYGFIFTADNIALSHLFVQWIIVAIITGGLIYSLKVDPELIIKIRCRFLSWWTSPVTCSPQPYDELLKSEREKRKNQQGTAPPEKQTQKDKEL